MTLAIAAIEGDQVYLLTDTRITPPDHETKRLHIEPKLFFLDRCTAIAYAAKSATVALERLRAVAHWDLGLELTQLAYAIRDAYKDDVADFLLARCGASPKIAKVWDGGVSCIDAKFAWVGNGDAAAMVASASGSAGVDILDRFSQVVGSGNFKDVGGPAMAARGTVNGFVFLPSMRLISHRYLPVKGWQTVHFGTNRTGGFGWSTVVPTEPGVNGWGIFYFQGYRGSYFHTDFKAGRWERLEVYARDVEEFCSVVSANLGISLQHGGSLGQPCA